MLVIDPDECIDCGVCEPECPVEAIVPLQRMKKMIRLVVEFNKKFQRHGQIL